MAILAAVAALAAAVPALGARLLDAEANAVPEYKLYSAESDAGKEKMMDGLACYCKKVASVSECPLYKEDKDPTQPNRDRWFHASVTATEKPHLCCKLTQNKNSWYNRVGLGYERQAHFQLCTFEVRPLPSDACCRMGEDPSVNVHIKQATMEGQQIISQFHWKAKEFIKTHPMFEMDDVTGATDYDGSSLSAEDTREFLKKMAKSGQLGGYNEGEKLMCDRSFNEVLNDRDGCHLRENPTECCCAKDSLRRVERCLPVSAMSANADPGPLVITGTYHEEEYEGHRKGSITWPKKPTDDDKDLPPSLNLPDQTGNSDLPWNVDYQWDVRCLRKQRVARVKKKLHMERVFKHYSREKQIWNTYHQEYRRKCISWEYIRKCPPGQAYYVQQFSKGTCAKEPGRQRNDVQLIDHGNWTFECPEGYRSGKKGARKFDSRCKCDGC